MGACCTSDELFGAEPPPSNEAEKYVPVKPPKEEDIGSICSAINDTIFLEQRFFDTPAAHHTQSLEALLQVERSERRLLLALHRNSASVLFDVLVGRHRRVKGAKRPVAIVEIPRTEQLGVTAMNMELTVKPKNEGKWHEVRPKSKPVIEKNTWDFLSLPDAVKELNEGNTYFRFVCKTAQNLEDSDMDLIRMLVNLSCFEDEEIQNNVKRYNIDRDDEEFRKLRLIVTKTMYLLPGVRMEDISVERLCTVDYQRRCQPGKPKIWDDVTEPDVFRFTKSIIPLIFSMTVQFKVWLLDEKMRSELKCFDGQVPAMIMVMERTKRDISKVDSIAKLRNVLFYYEVPGGILTSMMTIVLNYSIPRLIASIIHTFGSSGANEAAQTSDMARGYYIQHFGDFRFPGSIGI